MPSYFCAITSDGFWLCLPTHVSKLPLCNKYVASYFSFSDHFSWVIYFLTMG